MSKYTDGGASAIGDYEKQGGDVSQLSTKQIALGGFGFWSDLAKANGGANFVITGTPVLSGSANTAYTGFTVSSSGGVSPYSYSLVGSWPEAITVNASSGEIAGTVSANTANVAFAGLSVKSTDSKSNVAYLQKFTITIG